MTLWDVKARFYDFFRSLPGMKQILDNEIRNLRQMVLENGCCPGNVVDIGTGTGASSMIYPDGLMIIGVDRSLSMLRKARNRFERFVGVVSDAKRLSFRSRTIPFLTAVGLLEYIKDKEMFLDEICRVLAPKGYFLMTLSPPGILTGIRNVLGSRIYPVRVSVLEEGAIRRGMICIDKKKSLLQVQYLFRSTA